MFDRSPLTLSADAIHRANAASQFDAGDVLANEANQIYLAGLSEMFDDVTDPTPKQAEVISARAAAWRDLCEKSYNDQIARRASWMPWTVCGPAGYNAKRNNARADADMKAAAVWTTKRHQFIANTLSMLHNAKPLEAILVEYRSGKRDDPISADDPAAVEKLTARLEYLREKHERGKAYNAHYRKNGTMKGFPGISDEKAAKMDAAISSDANICHVPYPPFSMQNATANMNRLQARLKEAQARRERSSVPGTAKAEQSFQGFAVTISEEDCRIYVTFDDKPDAPARDVLKKNGFHWSPREKAWTRKLTENARFTLRAYVIPGLLALDAYADAAPTAESSATVSPDAAQEAPEAPAPAAPAADPVTAAEAQEAAPDAPGNAAEPFDPAAVPAVLSSFGMVDCSACTVQGCIHRDAFRRNPRAVGGLALCPRLHVTDTPAPASPAADPVPAADAQQAAPDAPGNAAEPFDPARALAAPVADADGIPTLTLYEFAALMRSRA